MTSAVPLLNVYVDWECPNCHLQERTRPLPEGAHRYHSCPGLHGLTAPLVEKGSDVKVVAVERADYLRKEHQRMGDDGKPYMAVETVHADGHNDVAAFAAAAYVSLSAR